MSCLMPGAVVMVLPILWMLATSFKPAAEIADLAAAHAAARRRPWPTTRGIFEEAPFGRVLRQQRRLSVVATISVVVTSLVAGAVFAKYRFPGRTFLFMLVLATAIVPFESYMIPLYLQLV